MRVNEFKYGDIESGTYNITCGTEIHSILPEKRKYVQEIIGVDGVADFGIGGYGVRVITLPIYFDGNYADLRQNRDNIAAWLYNDGTPKKLILGTSPDRYYLAKVYAALEFENTSDRHIGDIQFECNPPWQYLLDGTLMTPEQITYVNCTTDGGQFIKEFTGSGSIRFVNNGTQSVKPIIKLIGNVKSGITLTCGEAVLKLNTNVGFDGVKIDCDNETVTRMSGGNLYEYLDPSKSDFFLLPPGNCEIELSGSGIGSYPDSVTMIVQFNAITKG